MAEVLFILVLVAVGGTMAALVYYVTLQARYPEPVHAHEIHVVTTDDGWQLRLHRRKPAAGGGEPVFFMHSLASNHLNFEVPHGYSLVDYLVNEGYDCWTFDSRACRDAAPPRRNMRFTSTVDDLLLKDVPAALAQIRSITGHDKVHWIGHSMGGMLLYAYDLRFDGAGLASGVTLGSPPGFKGYRHTPHDGLVWLNYRAHTFFSCAFRGLIPFFDIWHPISRLVPINWDNVHSKLHAPELFHAAEMPTPGIGDQMNGWASGAPWVMCGGTLNVDKNLHRVKTPLLAVFGGSDPFVSQARAHEFFDAIENRDKQMIFLSRANGDSANYSHIDLAFAREGEREVFEPILAWLGAHSIDGRTGRTIPAAKRRARKKDIVLETPDAPSVPADNVHLSAASSVAKKRAATAKRSAAKAKPSAGKPKPKVKPKAKPTPKRKPATRNKRT